MTEEKPVVGGVREVKSAARTVAVLDYLAGRAARPARLREVSEAIGAPRSSTYALLQTLVGLGWVSVDDGGNLYRIGIRALLVGTSYLDADPRVRVVRPLLVSANEKLDETVHMGRLDGDQVVYLATVESRQYLRPFTRVGRRLPAAATALGKSILAERPADDVPSELVPVTPHTIGDRKELFADLEEARARGYAIDREENTLGVYCFGFALHYGDQVTDAISCSVPIARLDETRIGVIVDAMEQVRQQAQAFIAI